MIPIRFPDRDTEKRALAILLGRFAGHILRSREHMLPQAALEALTDQNISFTVSENSTHDQPLAAFRNSASAAV